MASTDFTIADVLAWARTKPADERYDFTSSLTCALAQFGVATGRPHLVGLSGSAFLDDHPELIRAFCGSGRDTFGRLVRELQKLLPAEPLSDTWTKADAYAVAREQVSA